MERENGLSFRVSMDTQEETATNTASLPVTPEISLPENNFSAVNHKSSLFPSLEVNPKLAKTAARALIIAGALTSGVGYVNEAKAQDSADAQPTSIPTATATPNGEVNLRVLPTKESTLEGTANSGNVLTVEGEATNQFGEKWFRVVLPDGTKSWVLSSLLSVSPTEKPLWDLTSVSSIRMNNKPGQAEALTLGATDLNLASIKEALDSFVTYGIPAETISPDSIQIMQITDSHLIAEQLRDIPAPDNNINEAHSILILAKQNDTYLPQVFLEPRVINDVINKDFGITQSATFSPGGPDGYLRFGNDIFNYDLAISGIRSGISQEAALKQAYIKVNGQTLPSDIDFGINIAQDGSSNLNVRGVDFPVTFNNEKGIWEVTIDSLPENLFNPDVDKYVWGQEVSIQHISGTTYELNIGGKKLVKDYPEYPDGLPFSADSEYTLTNTGISVNFAGIYLGEKKPVDPNNPNEFREIYVFYPSINGQSLVIAAGSPESQTGMTYIDMADPRYRTSPNYTPEQFDEFLSTRQSAGDLVQVGVIDMNKLPADVSGSQFFSAARGRYHQNSAMDLFNVIRNLDTFSPGGVKFLEVGPITGITAEPLLFSRHTTR